MIIWQGLGFLGFLLPVAFFFVGVVLADAVFGHGYSAGHGWPGSIAVLLSAVVLWVLSERLSAPGRTLVDPRTGQAVQLRRKHTLFWIPLRYIALIMVAVAVFLMFVPHGR